MSDATHPLEALAPIETERLHLRVIEEADLEALMLVNGDPQVTRYLPYEAWRDMDDAQRWYTRMMRLQSDGNSCQYVLVDKTSQRAIGTCLLFRYERLSQRAELGYVLGRAHAGQGLMREALAALIASAFASGALRRIEADIDPRNTASAALARALGFELEGVLRQRWLTKGVLQDSAMYGLLR